MSCRLTKWLLITLLFSPLIAQAQFNADMVIEKARGKKVVFSLGFDNIKPGDVLIALDERDRRRGVVKVLKVGRNKALGSVLKGQALNGWFLEKYKRQKRKSKRRPKKRPSFEDEFGEEEDSEDDFERNDENEYENDEAEEDGFSDESSDEEEDDFDAYDKPKKRSRVDLNRKRKGGRVYYVGALLSKSSYTLNVDIPNGDSTTSVSMTDSPTNFHAYLRTRFNDTFDIIATLGSESYSSTGEVTDSACSGSNECQTNVNYISLRGLAAYKLDFADINPWIGAGVGFMSPGSAESNAVEPETISSTIVFLGAIGMQWEFDQQWSVPAQAVYTYFPSSEGVSTKILALQLGVAYSF